MLQTSKDDVDEGAAYLVVCASERATPPTLVSKLRLPRCGSAIRLSTLIPLSTVGLCIKSMALRASDRALHSPEILHNVFEALGNPRAEPGDGVGSALVSCALVSKLWSIIVLPIIWNSCEGAAIGLFGVLDALDTRRGPAVSSFAVNLRRKTNVST